MGVLGLIVFRWVHSGAPWGSFGSFGQALGVVGLIGVRWVHSCAAWLSSGSFGFVGFTRARPGVGRVYLGAPWGSLCSFWRPLRSAGLFALYGRTLEDVVFFRVRSVHLGAPWGVGCDWFIRARPSGRLVHWRVHWGSFGLLVFVGFINARRRDGRVHLGSLSSVRHALVVVQFIRARPCGQSGPLGLFGQALGIVAFIRVRWVHSSALGGFIRVRWVYSRAPWELSCSFGFVRYVWASCCLCACRRAQGVVGFVGLICVPWVH